MRVFSLQIRCSGLHFENCLLQIKHLCRYASDKHMYLCTQRCVHIFSQTNVHMMPAPRSLHLPTACACSAAQLRCRRGLAAPDHAGDLPGKVNPRCHTGCGARLPAPTGPRAARPTPTQAARSTGGGGGAASAPEAPPSARGSFFIFKRLRRTRPAPRAAAAGGSERSEAEEAPPPRRRLPASGGGGRRRAGEGRERGEELRQKVKAVTKGKSQTVRSSQRLRHSTLGREEWGPARHK